MSDPLSIAAGVVGLLQVTYSVAAELKKFCDGVATVNQTIAALQQEVDILSQVLESARTTFEAVTADFGTGLLASHWRNVAHLIDNCKGVVSHFCHDLVEINKPCNTLDRTRKQLRLRFADDKVASFRVLVQTFHGSLSVSLQSIIIFNQATLQRTVETTLPNLSELEKNVRCIALQLKTILHDRASKEPEEVCAFDQMRECVRTAKSVLSSATTIADSLHKHSGLKSDCGTVAAGSDINDCFSPMQDKLLLHRYMISRCSYEDRVAAYPQPAYFAKHHAHDLPEDQSDSDAEVQTDVVEAHLNSGTDALWRGDHVVAEKKLQNCLHRLSNSPKNGDLPAKLVSIKLDAMNGLLEIYTGQQRWDDSAEILQAKISLREKFGHEEGTGKLDDLFKLARTMRARGSVDEAHIYARKALKGFKKLGDQTKAMSCLELIADIQEEESSTEVDLPRALPLRVIRGNRASFADQQDRKGLSKPSSNDWPLDDLASQLSLEQHAPLSPPQTPNEHERQPSPARPNLTRLPVYNVPERPSTPNSSRSSTRDAHPEIIITPSEELENILTIDTQTTATSLSPSSGRGRRSSNETTVETDTEATERSGDETDKSGRQSRRLSITTSTRNKSPRSKTRKVEIVVFGDIGSDSAKTLSMYCPNRNGDTTSSMHQPRNTFIHEMDHDGRAIEMSFTVIGGAESTQLPQGTNAILTCFSIGSPICLQDLRTRWIPHITQKYPGIPIILVGTHPELREDMQTVLSLAQNFQHPVTPLEAEDVLRQTGIRKYMECSAQTGNGIKQLVEEAGRAGSMHVKRSTSRWKLFS